MDRHLTITLPDNMRLPHGIRVAVRVPSREGAAAISFDADVRVVHVRGDTGFPSDCGDGGLAIQATSPFCSIIISGYDANRLRRFVEAMFEAVAHTD